MPDVREMARMIFGGLHDRYLDARFKRLALKRQPDLKLSRGARAIGCACIEEGVRVGEYTILKDCRVGRHTYFSSKSRLHKCNVGRFCSIGPELLAGLGRHPTREYVSTYPAFYTREGGSALDFGCDSDFEIHRGINIGHDVLISARVTILDGVAIGNGAIVGAGAVVARNVPDYAVVAGVPARLIRYRFQEDEIAFLNGLKWWDRDLAWIRAHAACFQNIRTLMAKADEDPGRLTR